MKTQAQLAARLIELEDLILQLDSTFADIETARRKGYMARDMPRLRAEADHIRQERRER
jgi:hypothetical protein